MTTSSNGIPAKAPFATVAAGPLGGHVGDTSGNHARGGRGPSLPLAGRSVLRRIERTKRRFKEVVPYGDYRLTAFPPEGTSLGQSTGSQVAAISSRAGMDAANVTMPVLQPLPTGLSIAGQDGASRFLLREPCAVDGPGMPPRDRGGRVPGNRYHDRQKRHVPYRSGGVARRIGPVLGAASAVVAGPRRRLH